MELIDRQAAIDAINELHDKPNAWLDLAVDALENLPSAHPVTTDTNVRDTISRKGVFIPNITVEMFRNASLEGVEDLMASGEMEDISLPSAQPETPCYLGSPCEYQNPDVVISQPEPSIPLSWIEEHIEWLKSLDNEFANLAAAHISVMVKKWRGEQDDSV